MTENLRLLHTATDALRRRFAQAEVRSTVLALLVLRRFHPERFAGDPQDVLTGPVDRGVSEVLEGLRLEHHVAQMHRAGVLNPVVEAVRKIDLQDGPGTRSAEDLLDVLLREADDARGGDSEHTTPASISGLMARLLMSDDSPTALAAVYDPACGFGGALVAAAKRLETRTRNTTALMLFGQDINVEAIAIARARMLLLGLSDADLRSGNTLVDDSHDGVQADYVVSNPPFGMHWQSSQEAVQSEHERARGSGRFGPGLPRRSDASLLFLMHMLSKMKPVEKGGGRMAMLTAGSPLWSGSPGSGESEIRRHVIHGDLLEAVVALPGGLLPYTGIPTFIWVLSNRKAQASRGLVRLIDATELYEQQGRRRVISSEQADAVLRLLTELDTPSPLVRVYKNAEFASYHLTIDRPLRLRISVAPPGLAELKEDRIWAKWASQAPDRAALAEQVLLQQQGRSFDDRASWRVAIRDLFHEVSLDVPERVLLAIETALGERSEEAAVCRDVRGKVEPDPTLRREEVLPLSDTRTEADALATLPPDGWVSERKVRYAIERVRHLGFSLIRELGLVREAYKDSQLVPMGTLCRRISNVREPSRSADPPSIWSRVRLLRDVVVETDDSLVDPAYLPMFFSTDLGTRLLTALAAGSTLPRVWAEDLRTLLVPVPPLAAQQKLVRAKRQIDDVAALLTRVEAELAANPDNVDAVNTTVVPMLQALGRLSDADEVRERIRAGESKRVEFKETFCLNVHTQTADPKIEESALKTVVAFLNSEGGDLLLGVADDGRLTGLGPEIAKFHKGVTDKFLVHVANKLRVRIGEPFYPLIDQRLVMTDGAPVLWVRCTPAPRPVFLDDEAFYVRTNPATDKLTGRKLADYLATRFPSA